MCCWLVVFVEMDCEVEVFGGEVDDIVVGL